MASKASNAGLEAKTPRKGRSKSRSKSRSPGPKGRSKQSKVHDYRSDGVKDYDVLNLPVSDYKIMLVITAIATVVRLFRIYQPSSVVFDEVHFGGFATKYIKGKFFMDVHPPLAKLLITLAGHLAGFKGDFDFKEIGKDYLGPGVPYVAMRMLPAIMGIMTVPTMFLTLKATGCRTSTASFGALLVTFENALITQSRFILLDSPLIIFTALTILSFVSFSNQHEQGPPKAFGSSWWFWLVASGLFLGATASVKWVGLFTIAWVGSLTLVQLWVLLGDSKTVTPRIWFKHFFARVFCLIIIPVGFYMAMFGIHFLCLRNPGEGDGFMSSEFQATLNSKGMSDAPADVVFGSRVSIRHHNTQGGYLHSHNHMYPGGSKQQQITLYPHKDDNNVFILENQTQPLGPYGQVPGPRAWDNITAEHVMDGSTIKLYHMATDRRLHSHDVRPPVTEADWQFEVSAYGYEGFEGDANDLFRVEIVPSLSHGAEAKKRLRTIETKFKLVHVMTGCVLFSHKVKLPEWGFEQQEVTCAKGGSLPNSIWYIEQNSQPALPDDVEKVNYKIPGFFAKFWELHKVMWRTNAGLVDSHAWDSRPPSWPILSRGINFWGRHHRHIYLIGNPIIWWTSTAAVVVWVVFKAFAILRWQRGFKDYDYVHFKRFDYEIGQTLLGWALHYFPFYLMARQLFLHHYLPALYFAILALCQMYDFTANRFTKPSIFGKLYIVGFLTLSIAAFALLSPLAYGNIWTRDMCQKTKLISTWDFDCNLFHTDLSQYSTPEVISTPDASKTAVAPPPVQQKLEEKKQEQQSPQQENQAPVKPESVDSPPKDQEIRKIREVEYRDKDGNILNEAQVKSLESQGEISFETRYETRTRLIDSQGREIPKEALVAPEHPDVQGSNPETVAKDVPEVPADKPAAVEGEEKSVQREEGKPKPASEANAATN